MERKHPDRIAVVSLSGEIVRDFRLDAKAAASWDVSPGLPSGVYLLRWSYGGKTLGSGAIPLN